MEGWPQDQSQSENQVQEFSWSDWKEQSPCFCQPRPTSRRCLHLEVLKAVSCQYKGAPPENKQKQSQVEMRDDCKQVPDKFEPLDPATPAANGSWTFVLLLLAPVYTMSLVIPGNREF